MKKKRVLNKKYLKNSILQVFKQQPSRKFNYKQVSKLLRLKKVGEKVLVYEALNELTKNGLLKEPKTGSFILTNKNSTEKGRVIINNRSGVVVELSDGQEVFVDKKDSFFSLTGDLVEVVSLKTKKSSERGFITHVTERKRSSFVGKVQNNNGVPFFIPDDYKIYFDIYLTNKKGLKEAKGKKVHVTVTDWNTENKNPSGKIIETLGDIQSYETEVSAILIDKGFDYRFKAELEQKANSFSSKISKKDLLKRLDLRTITTFTIDPEDAKDFDDALSIKQLKNKNWQVGVHIADVSHYVQSGDIIDKEAFNRGTSVYLVDRVIPMLPEKLSNDLCSLRPNVDRLCFSVVFEINNKAKVLNYEIAKTIIHSNKRFTYEEAQNNINSNSGELFHELTTLNSIAKILRDRRKEKGSINFEKEETRFNLDDKKEPIGVYVKQSLDTNKLIEEFMLLANKTVSEHLNKRVSKKSFVYRVHDQPDKERIEDLKKIVKKYKYNIQNDNPKVLSKSLNLLLEKINDQPEKNLIETLVLRSMAKAKYSTKNIGHYGLAFPFYSHFTSPIRRYPDLVVHRLIENYINKTKTVIDLDLDYVCKHCSEKEKQAAIAERESIKFMQIKYLSNKVGDLFSGVISGVTDWGIYVELEKNKCEGLIKIKNLSDSFLIFDKKTHTLTNSDSSIVYQLGQKIDIRVVEVDLEKKLIDFSLA